MPHHSKSIPPKTEWKLVLNDMAPHSPIDSQKRNLHLKMDAIHFRIKMGGSFSTSEHVKHSSEIRVQKGKRGN